MAGALRVMVEAGPKGKRVVAVAPDWPGLSRGAKTEEAALATLRAYHARYAPVAQLAGLGEAFAANTDLAVIERYPGTGSTDFWGISFAHASLDKEPLSADELDRHLTLLRACWTFFDEVGARVSAELRKGPRGGGRDRDRVIRHTLGVERGFAEQVGVRAPEEEIFTADGLRTHRDSYLAAIRAYHAEGKTAGKSPLRYLIRHTAFHTLDHAWEMEDKDLTDSEA